jgi:hypothetical protein
LGEREEFTGVACHCLCVPILSTPTTPQELALRWEKVQVPWIGLYVSIMHRQG